MKTLLIISIFIICNSNLFAGENNVALQALAIQIKEQPTPVKPTSKKFERSAKFTKVARDKMNGHFPRSKNLLNVTNENKKTTNLKQSK